MLAANFLESYFKEIIVSRVGKKIINLPKDVQVVCGDNAIEVSGPKGKLLLENMSKSIVLEISEGVITFTRLSEDKTTRALHGLYRATLANLITGVQSGFKKDLELQGVGYKVILKGKNLEFSLGFSHPVVIEPPKGIEFTVDGATKLSISGIDKQLVGQVTADIRALKSPDPYKGKGIRYQGEFIKKKQGKSVKK